MSSTNNPLIYTDPTGNNVYLKDGGIDFNGFSIWGSQGSGGWFGNGTRRQAMGLYNAGPSGEDYYAAKGNSSYSYVDGLNKFRNGNGELLGYNELYSNYIVSNSDRIQDQNKFIDYFNEGFSIYYYALYGRDNIVASIGDPGLYSIYSGGYRASNGTASIFPVEGTQSGGDNYTMLEMSDPLKFAASTSSGTISIVQGAAYKTAEVVEKYAGRVGKFLGVVGLYNTASTMWNDPDKRTWTDWTKLGAETTMVLAKTNPYTICISLTYNIFDASGYNPFDMLKEQLNINKKK